MKSRVHEDEEKEMIDLLPYSNLERTGKKDSMGKL